MCVTIKKISFGQDRTTSLIILKNDDVTVELVAYGAHLYRVLTKDKAGKLENIVLNVTPISDLRDDLQYFGATVGPVAGRIKQAKIGSLALEANDHGNSLHSGSQGWSFQEWDLAWHEAKNVITVTFSYLDDKSGFPGPIQAAVIYRLAGNQLSITFTGVSPVKSYFNPTNHSYFNLSGELRQDIREQNLMISASHILATDDALIPTGAFMPVVDTPYDFTATTRLARHLDSLPNGLDTAFVFSPASLVNTVCLSDDASGRTLEVTSHARSVIVYSASGWQRTTHVNHRPMVSALGLAIEFQEMPDTPNHPEWGSIALLPNQQASKVINYKFGVK